jgi:hypothetical protein
MNKSGRLPLFLVKVYLAVASPAQSGSKSNTCNVVPWNTKWYDTLPGGLREAPFDRCDREQDYEMVWAEFERRLRGKRAVT